MALCMGGLPERRLKNAARAAAFGSAASAAPLLHPVGTDANHCPVEFTAIECRNRSACLVPFHFDDREPLAIAGKQVFGEFQGANHTILGKQAGQVIFCGGSGEATNGKGNQ